MTGPYPPIPWGLITSVSARRELSRYSVHEFRDESCDWLLVCRNSAPAGSSTHGSSRPGRARAVTSAFAVAIAVLSGRRTKVL